MAKRSNKPAVDFVRAGTLDELKDKERLVVRGRHLPILVVYDHGQVYALDNRCPHMGFPLDRGSIEDGVLTCHWHHARFDLASGCTFDLWADDVLACPVEVRSGEVWVKPVFELPDPKTHWRRRLGHGMAHDLGLQIGKAVQGLLDNGVAPAEIVREAALFGASQRDGWGVGLTILAALGNLLPALPERETYLALFHGVRRVATDCVGEAPRRDRAPLESAPDLGQLMRWLRRWSAVRHREGAERTVLTAISAGASPAELCDLLMAAETDRVYADGGHSLDFINKAFECLDTVGCDAAEAILPSVVGQMVAARGGEEETEWRQPVDLVALLEPIFDGLPALIEAGRGKGAWQDHIALSQAVLGDDPRAILEALKQAISRGATSIDLARCVAYAAALRVARFGTANEHSDWETAHHVFTYCNAVHQALKRIGGKAAAQAAPDAVRGVFQGAMAVYLARYLNVPPARMPGEGGDELDDLPTAADELQHALVDVFDRQRQVDTAARLVARYLLLGHSSKKLIATLAHVLLREDAGFHAYQMLEAGVRQFGEWGPGDQGRHVLVAVARYLAAHSPTERAAFQSAEIARRLVRGGVLHEDESTAG